MEPTPSTPISDPYTPNTPHSNIPSTRFSLKADSSMKMDQSEVLFDGPAEQVNQAAQVKKKPRDPLFIPVTYYVPRKICQKCFEAIDSIDSAERPGLIFESSLRGMCDRFYGTFGAEKHREQVENLIEHLRRHTRRRRGEDVLKEGLLEWENTSRVYEMFRVDLNIFERIFFTVDVSESTSVLSKFCSGFLILAIVISIVNWMVSTLPDMTEIPSCEESPPAGSSYSDNWCCTEPGDCAPEAKGFFKTVENVTVGIFTLEYIIRLFTVHSVRFELLNDFFLEKNLTGDDDSEASQKTHQKLDNKIMTTIKHVFATSNLIDVLSILPFWIEKFSEDGSGASVLVILRILRLTRIFRVFKVGKYNDVFLMFSSVMHQSIPALGLMLFFIAMGLCLFGTLIWFAERGTWYPENHPKLEEVGITGRGAFLRSISSIDPNVMDETPFPSIVHSFWFVIVTITTVGYGDAFPTTDAGKFVGTLTILSGIVVLAMPVGVIGSNFSNEYAQREAEKKQRLKLKQQQEQTALVEQEQDAAVDMELKGKAAAKPAVTKESQGAELMQKIIIDAEEMDNSWKECFQDQVHEWLSRCLRQFVSEFVDSSKNSGKSMAKGGRVTNLPQRLDQLGLRFNEACSSAVSYDELAEFGLKEAREKRRTFQMFTDKIWEFWATIGPPEKPVDPFEYFELKTLATSNMDAFASQNLKSPVTDSGPLSKKEPQHASPQMNELLKTEKTPSAPHVSTPQGRERPPTVQDVPLPGVPASAEDSEPNGETKPRES